MFTAADIFNAIVGYYVLVLAGSAAIGATRALRDPNPAALAAASADPASGAVASAAAAPAGRTARITGLAHSRTLHAFHRFGWATGVGAALGWLAGRDMYRWTKPRAAALARRGKDRFSRRSEGPRGPHDGTPPPPAPIPASAPGPAPTASAPEGTAPATGASSRPDPAADRWSDIDPRRFGIPEADPAALTRPPADRDTTRAPDDATSPPPAPGGGVVTWPEDPRRPGRPLLVLVPEPQEYPKIMPAAEIYDMESLVNFTGQVTDATVLESEDAAAASASMIAGAEFAGNTALRVADETTSLEAAVAAMAMLRVDAESTAAYTALLEAGQAYRDTTATFSVQCHDAAATAGQMAAAAANYHETARVALETLNRHQMPHAEAASATGHSGAHGAFYGVADTGGQDALSGAGAPQLPAS